MKNIVDKAASVKKSRGATRARKIGRPAGSNREETIARIRSSAMRIFTEKGYAATSFKDIAKDIHVTPATIYQYFDSKESLYVSLFDEIFRVLEPRYTRAVASARHVREQISALLAVTLENYEITPEFSPFLAGATIDIGRDPELRAYFSHRSGTLNDMITEIFEQAKRRGELPAELDSENIASVFFGALMGILLRQRGRQAGSVQEAINIFQMLVDNRLFHEA